MKVEMGSVNFKNSVGIFERSFTSSQEEFSSIYE